MAKDDERASPQVELTPLVRALSKPVMLCSSLAAGRSRPRLLCTNVVSDPPPPHPPRERREWAEISGLAHSRATCAACVCSATDKAAILGPPAPLRARP